MTISSIWATPEAIAWSMNFSYNDYLTVILPSYSTTPVDELMYKALCTAFKDHMTRDFEKGTF